MFWNEHLKNFLLNVLQIFFRNKTLLKLNQSSENIPCYLETVIMNIDIVNHKEAALYGGQFCPKQ